MSYAGHLKDTNENLLITTNYLNVWHFLFHMVHLLNFHSIYNNLSIFNTDTNFTFEESLKIHLNK